MAVFTVFYFATSKLIPVSKLPGNPTYRPREVFGVFRFSFSVALAAQVKVSHATAGFG